MRVPPRCVRVAAGVRRLAESRVYDQVVTGSLVPGTGVSQLCDFD